jgi:hypothetical protein
MNLLQKQKNGQQLECWLDCIVLKLRKKAKDWFTNLSGESKSKSWEHFLTLFLEEFSNNDHRNTVAKLYLIRQKKKEKLKHYFARYSKYIKKHERAVKREVSIRYAKAQSEKSKQASYC